MQKAIPQKLQSAVVQGYILFGISYLKHIEYNNAFRFYADMLAGKSKYKLFA